MPRRRRPCSRPHRKATRVATLSEHFTHQALIDSDADSASLSDSVCEDYITNILSTEVTADGNQPYEPLDLTKGLNMELFSSTLEVADAVLDDAEVISSSGSVSGEDEAEEIALSVSPVSASTPESLRHAPFISTVPEDSDVSTPPHLRQRQREMWELVETQIIQAYHYFKENPVLGATFQCVPMPCNKTRLAIHRCAEVLGAVSHSTGKGDLRFVTLMWNKDGTFNHSVEDIRDAVRRILSEMLRSQPHVHHKDKRTLKRALRRAKKLKSEAHFAKEHEDSELIETLIASKDWEGLERYFDGRETPTSGRKKKKGKQERRSPGRIERDISKQFADHDDTNSSSLEWNPKTRAGAAVLAKPLEKSNKGFAMLSKMGWQEGEGLGIEKRGRTEPVRPERLFSRAGLGT